MDGPDQKLNVGHSIRSFPDFAGTLERIESPRHGVKLVEVRLGNFSVRYARIGRRVATRSWTRAALLALVSLLTAAGLWVWHLRQPVVAPAIRIVLQGSPSPSTTHAKTSPILGPQPIPRPVIPPAAGSSPARDKRQELVRSAPSGSPAQPAAPDIPQSRDADFTQWQAVRLALGNALASGEVQDWTDDAAFGVVVPGPLMEGSDRRCRNMAILKRQEGHEAETRSGTWCLTASGAATLSR